MAERTEEHALKPARCGCGGEVWKVCADGSTDCYYICSQCGIGTTLYPSEAEAVTAWNRAMGSAEKSSTVERKKGKWIVHDYALGRERYECADCKGRCDLEYNFCPNCGADMRGKDDILGS